MKTLRNLSRRKLRTTLTVMGITVGVFALVVFGSMGNKINSLVDGGSRYYADKVIVTDKAGGGSMGSIAPMQISLVDQIHHLPGVAAATPEIVMLLNPGAGSAGFSVPDLITGSIPGADGGRESFKVSAAQGRVLGPEDMRANNVVLGSDLALKTGKHVGDTMTLRGEAFTVVGILEPTLTAPDSCAQLALPAAQRLFMKDMPPMISQRLTPSDLATGIVVYPTPGTDTTALADLIEQRIPNASAATGADFDKAVSSVKSLFNGIVLGVMLISLIVGGLSVINTMAMAVAERTREIGIKRAIGGSRIRVVRELVLESGLIGLIGGLIGLVFGALLVFVANEAGRSGGTVLFQLTSATAVFAITFATILGVVAGIIPALHAARLDPVTALRYE